ncbi:MAG TPA: hypothetical protein V6D11_07715 [Waterburya sp.]
MFFAVIARQFLQYNSLNIQICELIFRLLLMRSGGEGWRDR